MFLVKKKNMMFHVTFGYHAQLDWLFNNIPFIKCSSSPNLDINAFGTVLQCGRVGNDYSKLLLGTLNRKPIYQ